MAGVTHQNQRTAAVTGAGSGLGRDVALGLLFSEAPARVAPTGQTQGELA